MDERHLSLSEVAQLLDKSERTIRRWIKSGKLRAYKPGRDYLIPESALRDLIAESEVHPKAPAPPSLEPTFNDVLAEERRSTMERYLEALPKEEARRHLGAVFGEWLSQEEGIGSREHFAAVRLAEEIGIKVDDLRDRLMLLHPDITRDFIRAATQQKEAERTYWAALNREVEAGRLDPAEAADRFRALETA